MPNMNEASLQNVHLSNLYLDPNNYRLINEPEYTKVAPEKIQDSNIQRRTLRLLQGAKSQRIKDLIDSFKANGYLPVDQIQVKKLDDGKYLVVEGNRRIATLKHLAAQYTENSIDLDNLDPSIFDEIPVVIYPEGDDLHYRTIAALNHIGGKKPWGEWNQAQLLRELHSQYGLSEDEICKRIGIGKTTLRRNFRALSLIDQYLASDYGDQFAEQSFPLFKEIILSPALKDWLGWDDGSYKATNSINKELLFSWISSDVIEQRDENGTLTSVSQREPAITKWSEVRLLSKIINDESAMAQFYETLDINLAYQASDAVFEQQQQSAIATVSKNVSKIRQLNIQPDNLPALENSYRTLKSIIDRTRAIEFSSVEQATVFHDRLDRHFSSINIIEYKKLKQLQLSKLAKLNLIAGLNDSGKTTLLEAISLLCHQNDFTGLLEVIRRRGKVSEDQIIPEWFAEQIDGKMRIDGVFDNVPACISISSEREKSSEIDMSQYLTSVHIDSRFGDESQVSKTRLFRNRSLDTRAVDFKMLCPVVLSSPFFLNEPHRHTTFYHKSVQSKSLPQIFEFIERKVAQTISDIRLVDEWQRFLVTDKDHARAFDLTKYGDGLQRIFFISLLFASAQNGVVLIDEIENAIHADLITEFAEFIYELANEFNVQVFLSSHSKECIDAFVKNIPATDFSACALVHDDGRIVAREFTGELFKQLVRAGNVDLRRAH